MAITFCFHQAKRKIPEPGQKNEHVRPDNIKKQLQGRKETFRYLLAVTAER